MISGGPARILPGMRYEDFIADKANVGSLSGFDPSWMSPQLFDFQRALVEWAVRKGRAAIFADCGLGKTAMQLAFAENCVRHTGRPALILTPLAVSAQTVAEADKFGVDCRRSQDGKIDGARVYVTNYERLDRFDRHDFAAVVCDESSILKNFDGATKQAVTDFARHLPYRLLCTATAAPNDYVELGTSSEALGELGHMDMLARFFKNDQGTCDTGSQYEKGGAKWRFKRHAESAFWRWVCSWARAVRKPSDLGFDDGRFVLPPITEREHVIKARSSRPGYLFDVPAFGLREEREERRRTVAERCEKVAELVAASDKALVWCHLNDEADMLARIIPGARQVKGGDSDDDKERTFLDFAQGDLRVMVTKPKIGAFGLNLQSCAHVVFFPSHSYEQYYQGVRRCWRFGQTRPVTVDVVATEGEAGIIGNMQRKAAQADAMFTALVAQMNSAIKIDRQARRGERKAEVPSWL